MRWKPARSTSRCRRPSWHRSPPRTGSSPGCADARILADRPIIAPMSKLRLVPSAGGAPLEIDGNKVVGRDATADVVVDHASVSRKHARIERTGEGWSVADQASANGTFINGQ